MQRTGRFPRNVQQCVFGRNPALYDRARLSYPRQLFDILADRCGLGPGTTLFEIGPGTGLATRELLRRGATRLVLIEADRRLARFLRQRLASREADVTILTSPFEETLLPKAKFDLGVAASSFHWLSPRKSLRLIARALRPGGWWAAWIQYYVDPYRGSPFQTTVQALYREHLGPTSLFPTRFVEARERARRLDQLRSAGCFRRVRREDLREDVTVSAARVEQAWSTFPHIACLPLRRRQAFLLDLRHALDAHFGGEVLLRTLTAVYTAQRRS